jgi:hypothetical protein
MPNPNGNPQSLVAAPRGDRRALRHGAYSTVTPDDDRREAIIEELLQLPHRCGLDRLAAEEIARLRIICERIDAALADGRVETRGGKLRALLEHRRRLNGQLERW